jgi:hypothetical protein
MAMSSGFVTKGEFKSEWLSHHGQGWPPGNYEADVTVPFYNAQPEVVRAALGERLQRMTGPHVKWVNPALKEELGKAASLNKIVRI